MKIKLKQFVAGFVFISLCGCSNSQPFKDAPIKYTPKMINEIYKQVKTYPEHPYYSISFAYKGCAIEIWLNDMPEFATLDVTGSIMILPLNVEILKTGLQRVVIKIYSPWLDKRPLTSDKVSVEARIELNNERDDINTKRLVEFKPLKIIKQDKTWGDDFDGKTSMTYTVEFNAVLPFKTIGWSNSKDLRKMPDIEQRVKAFYANFREKFAANDSVFFANVMYKKELEMAQALYMSGPEESSKRWKDLLEAVNRKKRYEFDSGNFKYIKLSDLALEFYGDGKVVGLVNKGKAAFNVRG
ncbi:MAG: hypothetical protein H7141_04965 [Burkholderiales bacterium]|nr:hypothetical protein [Bacteroidia bacterium]